MPTPASPRRWLDLLCVPLFRMPPLRHRWQRLGGHKARHARLPPPVLVVPGARHAEAAARAALHLHRLCDICPHRQAPLAAGPPFPALQPGGLRALSSSCGTAWLTLSSPSPCRHDAGPHQRPRAGDHHAVIPAGCAAWQPLPGFAAGLCMPGPDALILTIHDPFSCTFSFAVDITYSVVALGLLATVGALGTFGRDRVVFFRESAAGESLCVQARTRDLHALLLLLLLALVPAPATMQATHPAPALPAHLLPRPQSPGSLPRPGHF